MRTFCRSNHKCPTHGSVPWYTFVNELLALSTVKKKMDLIGSVGMCECDTRELPDHPLTKINSRMSFKLSGTQNTSCREFLVTDLINSFTGPKGHATFFLYLYSDIYTIQSLNRRLQEDSFKEIIKGVQRYTDRFVTPLLIPYGLKSDIKVEVLNYSPERFLGVIKFSGLPNGLGSKPWILHLISGLMRDAVSMALWDPWDALGRLRYPSENDTEGLLRYYFNRLIPRYQAIFKDSDLCVLSKRSLESTSYRNVHGNLYDVGYTGEEKLRFLLRGRIDLKSRGNAYYFSQPATGL